MSCNYTNSETGGCFRNQNSSGYCDFHTQLDSANRVGARRYFAKLRQLLRQNDGNWQGFIFPDYIYLQHTNLDLQLNIQDAKFGIISLTQVVFEKQINLSRCIFSGEITIRSSKFLEGIVALTSTFEHDVTVTSTTIENVFSSGGSEYLGNFFLTGRIGGPANFNACIFRNRASFQGARNITINIGAAMSAGASMTGAGLVFSNRPRLTGIKFLASKLRSLYIKVGSFFKKHLIAAIAKSRQVASRITVSIKATMYSVQRKYLPHRRTGVEITYLFYGDAHFENVVFENPRRVKFSGVNLTRSNFSGTHLSDVSFIDCNFYQPALRRNGLYEEISLRQQDFYSKRERLPLIENSYRSIRISLESVKDFTRANDFFIGEKESARKQLSTPRRLLFSVLALYKYLSNYGTSPLRCTGWFILLVVIHCALIESAHDDELKKYFQSAPIESTYKAGNINTQLKNVISIVGENYSRRILYSIQTMTLRRNKADIKVKPTVYNGYVNAIFSVLGPLIIGLIALSIRIKIKRF
ncbi:MAG: hypothetical protein DRR42_11900 [Gammaproteobacteria bacterium]|nr:MAG: hypothetical protein DRR42_11900 [Gammaproteobacteria bacterium]